MARPISDEELQLKKRARRRLVGAVVLVSAVAVILPMVLDSEPRPVNQNVDIRIPPPDAGEFTPRGTAATAAPGAATRVAPTGAAPKTDARASAPATPIADPSGASPKASARPQAARSETATAGSAKDAATAADGAYVVQVAALADAAKVRQLQKQMAGAGLKTYTEVVATKSGDVTRVRAGPYPTREAAEKARAQLKKAGLDGQVLPR